MSNGTWFKAGTEVELVDDYRPQMDCGLFRGLRVVEEPEAECGLPVGTERPGDEEICGFDEFDIYDDAGNLIQPAAELENIKG
mgnify:CR=1 FL=1